MSNISSMSHDELLSIKKELQAEYDRFVKAGKKLDISRGKPGNDQLILSKELLNLPGDAPTFVDGVEAANYGVLEGLPSARKLFSEILGTKPEQVFIGGSSSLSMMFDTISKAFTHGLLHSEKPWSKLDKVKFICVVPGYDRHFAICESFGIEMIPVLLLDDGPDMNMVYELIKDESVRGMWCVPKYSNPDGVSYSDETVRKIAAMKPAAKDFLLMWDNAYCIHEFDGEFVPFLDILSECEKHGNADMVFEFASTSKITFPGAGISCFACSEANMAYMKKIISKQIISYDKLNQLRHMLFFKNREGIMAHMKKLGAVLKPKFDVVLNALNEEIGPHHIANWYKPKGGYFVSLYTMAGTAKRISELCKGAGLVITPAGATYPYGNDPNDSHLRIAPSYPPIDELKEAMKLLCCCIKLAAVEKLLAE
ncbi:MAG TPA: aminotransferase class I/II-fold pyridoxal phosphate-dependent enzyme [Clostridiales bacterium]|jgi:DNA-binding transcriptional MocR family regulator|nr:aminotransferase class I/II-fold pyridoxal phosphate-dependent enzyme [Clostridiales bacterium]